MTFQWCWAPNSSAWLSQVLSRQWQTDNWLWGCQSGRQVLVQLLVFRIVPASIWKLQVTQKVTIQFLNGMYPPGPGDGWHDLNRMPCEWWVGFCSAGFDLAIFKVYQDLTILWSTEATWEEALGIPLSSSWILQVQFDWESSDFFF